jgi:FtsP/CotA-like multicopper oxidase with cupredoxin domain
MSNSTNTTRTTAAAAGATLAGSEAIAQTMPPLGPLSTAVPGPGDFAGGTVDFTRLGIKSNETFGNFGCTVFKENPRTPDWTTANAYFERTVHNVDVRMQDGSDVRCWAFGDPLRAPGQIRLPSPLIRVQEGDLVHVKLEASKGSHTIHHHGIEPTTINDGVGHVSMEVTDSYTYQFQPRHAGTFFYHCHKNTVTHFEMGLYGLLIVDPKPDAAGKVAAYTGGPYYDVEKFWVLDDMDPRWHRITDLDHDIGLCGEDGGLNIFEPKHFLISGTPTRPNVAADAQKIVAGPGKKILIRLLNASYSVLQVKINGLEAQVISVDGHALNKPWNSWMTIAPGTTFQMPTAQRYDLLIDTGSRANMGKTGTYKVEFEFQHWITRKVHNAGDPTYEGRSYTTITI